MDFNADFFDIITNNKLEPALKAISCKAAHCVDIDATKNLILKYDTNDFQLSAAPTYNLQLKYKVTGINAPIIKDANDKLGLDFNADFFDITTNNKLEPALKAIACKAAHCIDIDSTKNLILKYDINDFMIDTAVNHYNLKLKTSPVAGAIAPMEVTSDYKVKLDYDPAQFKSDSTKGLQLYTGSSGGLTNTSTGFVINLDGSSLALSASGIKQSYPITGINAPINIDVNNKIGLNLATVSGLQTTSGLAINLDGSSLTLK